MKRYLQAVATMILVAGSTMLTGCGDDDPVIPPDYGMSSVTFLHANPGNREVAFYRNDTIQVGSGTMKFKDFFNATTPNGPSVKYWVKGNDRATLRSQSGVQDSVNTTMVIYTGSTTTDSMFFASSTGGPSGTKAAVRFIHAAQDAGARDLRQDTPDGPAIAQNLKYKGANGAYIAVSTDVKSLWIVDPADSTNNILVSVNLALGQGYSIVLVGAENPVSTEYGWQGLVIADPN